MIKFGDVKTSPILSVKIEQQPSLTEELEKKSYCQPNVTASCFCGYFINDCKGYTGCLVNFYSVEGQK